MKPILKLCCCHRMLLKPIGYQRQPLKPFMKPLWCQWNHLLVIDAVFSKCSAAKINPLLKPIGGQSHRFFTRTVANENVFGTFRLPKKSYWSRSVATVLESVRLRLKPLLKPLGCHWHRFWNRSVVHKNDFKPVWLSPFLKRSFPMKTFVKPIGCQRNRFETVRLPVKPFRSRSVATDTVSETVWLLVKPFVNPFSDNKTDLETVWWSLKLILEQFGCLWNRLWNSSVANETVCEIARSPIIRF